ncbi:MAG: hypothetical protein PWR32_152 [Candidatus Woesearchaeota archaeon]|nr:hypothetical protein [Candidatus Woesearchaeota archaeon]
MKKAAIQLSFGLVLTILIIVAIFFVALKGISVLMSNVSQMQKDQFVSDLTSFYKQTLRLPSGSSIPVKISSKFDTLCFYNKNGDGSLNNLAPYEDVLTIETKNVFGIYRGKLIPLTSFSLATPKKEVCFNRTTSGLFNFTMISKGDSIDIK